MSLPTTTLSATVGSSDLIVVLGSVTSVTAPGMRLFMDGELMQVTAPANTTTGQVAVARGVGGSRSLPHVSGVTVYIGQSYQFYTQDPQGEPPVVPAVTPWINVINGNIWTVSGNAWVLTGGNAPTGNVTGPASATSGDLPSFGDTTGQVLADSGVLAASVVVGPASVTSGKVAVFSGTSGKLLAANATGATAGPFTTITGITVVNGLVTVLTGS